MLLLGLFEVGVHIADVSYFLKQGTALDKVAADRATSVYLVQKVSQWSVCLSVSVCLIMVELNCHSPYTGTAEFRTPIEDGQSGHNSEIMGYWWVTSFSMAVLSCNIATCMS